VAGDSGPASDADCWNPMPATEWTAFDFEFKNLLAFSQYVKCDYIRENTPEPEPLAP